MAGALSVVVASHGWSFRPVSENDDLTSISGATVPWRRLDTASSSSGFAARLNYYETVSGIDDTDLLASRVDSAIERSDPQSRNVELEVLFARLFELDPQSAFASLSASEISGASLSKVFRSWAEIDQEFAISLLAQIDDPRLENQLALSILDVYGSEPSLIERLVAAGRTLDTPGLRFAMVMLGAERDPFSALEAALTIPESGATQLALDKIAQHAVRTDPQRALALSDSIQNAQMRDRYLTTLRMEWAQSDARGFVQHVETLDLQGLFVFAQSSIGTPLLIAAEQDPALVLDAADDLSGAMQSVARAAGLEALAAVNPKAAFERVMRLEGAGEAVEYLRALARGYARFDLDAAISWATALNERDAAARYEVYETVASIDFARAIELELAYPSRWGSSGVSTPPWLMIGFLNDLENPALIADRLVAADGERAARFLGIIVERWGMSDPYGAITWLRAHGELSSNVVGRLGKRLGQRDLEQALSLALSLPDQHRPEWVEEAVGSAAFYDPAGAIAGLTSYRSEPFYEAAMGSVLAAATMRIGPRVAAELAGNDLPQSAAFAIAARWSETDPEGAAEWAAALSDPAARTSVIQIVLQRWVEQDVDRASGWARSVPDPMLRVELLNFICWRSTGAPDCD